MSMSALRVCRTLQLRRGRCFSVSSALPSGHSRWSKIKHDKAKEDASVTKQRSAMAAELTSVSRQYGPDPNMNPRLATVITTAKKMGFPKASIESAIARGQGVSPNGAPLENVTIEAMIPPSVAVIIECQTDSKARTLADVRLAVKEAGGSVTPTNHLFERKGKVVFERAENTEEVDIMDQAIEAGAIDVDIASEDGTQEVVLLTESSQTTAVASAMVQASGMRLKSLEIIWDPKAEMMVEVTSPEILTGFLGKHSQSTHMLQSDSFGQDGSMTPPSVQEVYTNAI